MAREIPTFHDAYHAVERFAARRGVGASAEDIRAAVIDAYQELVDRYPWSFQRKKYRINIVAPQSDGTVAYDYDNNELTLTDDTWPSDAIDWTVVIDNVTYDIETRTSDTVVTLNSTQQPTADIDAGTSYEAYQRYHVLPDDFVSMCDPMPESGSSILGTWMPPEELFSQMRYSPGSGEATSWTIAPVPDVYGRLAIFMWPAHGRAESLDIWYRSQPRPLRYVGNEQKCSAGTIAVTADSATVTGTSTTFENAMEGSIFRVGDHATYQPTGLTGVRPWTEQRSILTYASATSITLDGVIASSASGVKYTVTDPLDIDPAAVTALYRVAERNLSRTIGGREVSKDEKTADSAILAARGASNRTSQRRRVVGADQPLSKWPTTGTYSEWTESQS